MNIAEFAIRKSTVTWVLTTLLLFVGFKAYMGLPRLEDPEFAIKQATITTMYPGATAREVEQEVTDELEHNGLRSDGPRVFGKLRELTAQGLGSSE